MVNKKDQKNPPFVSHNLIPAQFTTTTKSYLFDVFNKRTFACHKERKIEKVGRHMDVVLYERKANICIK
jgi:hypothetical protein